MSCGWLGQPGGHGDPPALVHQCTLGSPLMSSTVHLALLLEFGGLMCYVYGTGFCVEEIGLVILETTL